MFLIIRFMSEAWEKSKNTLKSLVSSVAILLLILIQCDLNKVINPYVNLNISFSILARRFLLCSFELVQSLIRCERSAEWDAEAACRRSSGLDAGRNKKRRAFFKFRNEGFFSPVWDTASFIVEPKHRLPLRYFCFWFFRIVQFKTIFYFLLSHNFFHPLDFSELIKLFRSKIVFVFLVFNKSDWLKLFLWGGQMERIVSHNKS